MLLKDWIDELVEKILGRKVHKGLLQYFRYLLCGGVATITDAGSLFVMTHYLGAQYLIAAGISFAAGISVNYTLNTLLVFQSSGQKKKEFSLFVMIGLGGLLWTEIIMWILVGKLNFYIMAAKLVAIFLVLQWNFFMRKSFVFTPEHKFEEEIENL